MPQMPQGVAIRAVRMPEKFGWLDRRSIKCAAKSRASTYIVLNSSLTVLISASFSAD